MLLSLPREGGQAPHTLEMIFVLTVIDKRTYFVALLAFCENAVMLFPFAISCRLASLHDCGGAGSLRVCLMVVLGRLKQNEGGI